jgi:CrcB protein
MRYGVNLLALRMLGPGVPVGTVIVNILGSFCMGVAIVVLAGGASHRFAPLLLTGLLGGFTTFSAFSLDALTLYSRGAIWQAALYVGLSVIGALIAIAAGMALARWGMR